MDALSDVLRVVRLTGGVFLDAHFTAPWCVSARVGPEDCGRELAGPTQLIAYHYVVQGRLWLQIDGEPGAEIRAGEVLLLPRNDPHTLGSAIDLAPVRAEQLIQAPLAGGLAEIHHGGGGELTQIVCGFLACDSIGHPLFAALPRLMRLDVRSWAAGAWMENLFRYASQELAAGRPGAATGLAKISELLFVEAVRRYLESDAARRAGWLAGLSDPIIGRALALLHAQVAHPWSVDELAQRVFLSRSAFADRFSSLVGQPPLTYLATWRMQVAAQLLASGRSVAQVAAEVGYESVPAFSRAFKRERGIAPASWRRGQP